MATCNYIDSELSWNEYPEPYEDIEGLGVLAGFLGTAWLMIAILIVHYLVFFDPELDPFRSAAETPFKPNPIDKMLLGSIRSGQSYDLSRLRRSMTKCILSFVDLQLIAGLGILISGFLTLNSNLTAYHWSMIVYLAWLSNITHLSGLTALRGSFASRWELGWRLVLMFMFLVLLLVALGPTAFFNWHGDDLREIRYWLTVAGPKSLAKCYFSPGKILKAYYEQREDIPEVAPFYQSNAFQSTLVSMVLLILNFFSRVLRMFPFVFRVFTQSMRQRAHNLAQQALRKLSLARHRFSRVFNERQWCLVVLKPFLAALLVARLYVDILASTSSEIYWLLISSLWATLHLNQLKSIASEVRTDEKNTQWAFGQTLPVLMLLGPVITAAGAFVGDPESTHNSGGLQSNQGRADMVSQGRLLGRDSQHSSQADLVTQRLITGDQSEEMLDHEDDSRRFITQPGERVSPPLAEMQLEMDPDSQAQAWLRRNYYETNWAPAICFWSGLQICSIGVLTATSGASKSGVLEFGDPSNTAPLTVFRVVWVWALITQPAIIFALILINIAGEQFQGAARWFCRPAISHSLTFFAYLLGLIPFGLSIFKIEMGFGGPAAQAGLPAFTIACATSAFGIMLYVGIVFVKAR